MVVTDLPDGLEECSGMVFLDDQRLAMINDSGNEPAIFLLDTAGNLLEKVALPNLENIDWESMAVSEKEIFIGDFGNNGNRRRDLSVYVLSKADFSLQKRLDFYYPEQSGFPPEEPQKYYDLEAMIFRNDSLLLFTKNRTKPFDALVKVYYLDPHSEVEQAALLLQEFPIGKGLMQFMWVCGAEKGFNQKDLFLIGYQYLWYIPDLHCKELEILRYDLGYFSQKEALAINQGQLYFSEESNFTRVGKLHRADLSFLQDYQSDLAYQANLRSKHFQDTLQLELVNLGAYQGVKWQVYARDGGIAQTGTINFKDLEKNVLNLDLRAISKGSHLLSLEHYQQKQVFIIYRD